MLILIMFFSSHGISFCLFSSHGRDNLSSVFLLELKVVCCQLPKLSHCIIVSNLSVLKKNPHCLEDIFTLHVLFFHRYLTLLPEWYVCLPFMYGGGGGGACVFHIHEWEVYTCACRGQRRTVDVFLYCFLYSFETVSLNWRLAFWLG